MYERPDLYPDEFVVAWMPNYSIAGVSLLAKLMAMTKQDDIVHKLSDNVAVGYGEDAYKVIRDWFPRNSSLKAFKDKFADALKEMFASISKDFTAGLDAAERIVGNTSFAELGPALRLMVPEDRERLFLGLRFIPISFPGERVVRERNAITREIIEQIEKEVTPKKNGKSGPKRPASRARRAADVGFEIGPPGSFLKSLYEDVLSHQPPAPDQVQEEKTLPVTDTASEVAKQLCELADQPTPTQIEEALKAPWMDELKAAMEDKKEDH